MAYAAPTDPVPPARYTADRYFALVDDGVLDERDRVELLEGVVVAMSPRNVRHDAGVSRTDYALRAAIESRAVVRVQLSLMLGRYSVPEPDVAVVPGRVRDYDHVHPTTALLVVEVSDTSLPQDRLTKAGIYAAAGIPEYWIVNVRDDQVEVFLGPDAATGRYGERRIALRGEIIALRALPDATVAVDDLLPER